MKQNEEQNEIYAKKGKESLFFNLGKFDKTPIWLSPYW
jgi:hypothetical protein